MRPTGRFEFIRSGIGGKLIAETVCRQARTRCYVRMVQFRHHDFLSCLRTAVVSASTPMALAHLRPKRIRGHLDRSCVLYPLHAPNDAAGPADSAWRALPFTCSSVRECEERIRGPRIKNVGAGPMLNVFHWGQPVSERFQLGDAFLERPAAITRSHVGSMLRGEERTLETGIDDSARRLLLVLEGTDSIGGRHQFRYLRTQVDSANFEHQIHMIHPVDFLPLRRRAAAKVSEWRARIQRRRARKQI
jgi:hypothetical protein